ncbi:hypothetical protein M3Y94_00484700 [Aphelenchoides besseyi]|nr:hypothetical protein M3Y94_00484700 [Aphelenchoides besseyi]KAI6217415.1 Tudor domain-containing protein [Aphelenchoides besseyi]
MNLGEAAVVELYKMITSEDPNEQVSADSDDSYTRSKKKWKEGDACCAYYPDDGMYYPATIISINGRKVTVLYTEYEGEKQVVNVDQLLSESDVEQPAEDDDFDEEVTIMEVSTSGTVVYEKPQSSSSHGKKNVPTPKLVPPPPEIFSKFSTTTDEKKSLTNMLMSWYMAGYQTGYHEGLTARRQNPNGSNHLSTSKGRSPNKSKGYGR